MNEAAGGELSHVSDPTSWDEICRRFPDQWIVLVEIAWADDAGADIRNAFVAGSGTRREALRAARPLLGVFDKLGCFHTANPRVPSLPPILYTTVRRRPATARRAITSSELAFA